MLFEIKQIERALFERIRLQLVLDNYLPDVLSLSASAYLTELKRRKNDGLDTIEVFSDSITTEKGQVRYNRIFLQTTSFTQGTIGGGCAVSIPTGGGGFKELFLPTKTINIGFRATYITTKKNIDRYCGQMLRSAFQDNNKHFGINDDRTLTSYYFKTNYQRDFNTSEDEYFEKGIEFEVKDVFLIETSNQGKDISYLENFNYTLEHGSIH